MLGCLECLRWDRRVHCQIAIWKILISSPYREPLNFSYWLFPLHTEFDFCRFYLCFLREQKSLQNSVPLFQNTYNLICQSVSYVIVFRSFPYFPAFSYKSTKVDYFAFTKVHSLGQACYYVTISSALIWLLLLSAAIWEKKKDPHIAVSVWY